MRTSTRTKLAVVAAILGLGALLGSAAAASAATPGNMPQGGPAASVIVHAARGGMPSEGPQEMPEP
jgi:hypothetical protein